MLGDGLQFRRSRGGEDRFYNPAKARSVRIGNLNQDHLSRALSDVTASQSKSVVASKEREKKEPVALPAAFEPVASPLCNLERFLESIIPFVPAPYLSKTTMRGWGNCDVEFQPYFVLGDLWESFKEWSAYGAGVPLLLNDTDSVVQYYVPYLSGIQLYVDHSKSSVKSRRPGDDSDGDFRDSSSDGSSDCEHERGRMSYLREQLSYNHPTGEVPLRMDRLSLGDQHVALQEGFSSDEGESHNSQGCLLFEYLERDPPFGREPLADKISDLALRFPELKALRSCDLQSSSWISVAWYPIYRIPMGPTLKDLDACFLTFHPLHTPMTVTREERLNCKATHSLATRGYSSHPNIWLGNGATPMKLLQKGESLSNRMPVGSSKRCGLTWKPLTLVLRWYSLKEAKVLPDKYDERTYCVYDSDASTAYGLSAFGLLLISQTVVNGVTKCFCFGKGLISGTSTTAWAVFFFIFSWVSFLGAEACLLAGSAKNAYHTKYRGIFGGDDLSCATLRKGVFAAGAAMSLLSMAGSILYYWAHRKADTGGWEKHQNEGLGMTSSNFTENQQQQRPSQFEKV